MAYTQFDYPTKKSMIKDFSEGKEIRVYQPGGIFDLPSIKEGETKEICIEGPHYPKPHKWYARVEINSERKVVRIIQ